MLGNWLNPPLFIARRRGVGNPAGPDSRMSLFGPNLPKLHSPKKIFGVEPACQPPPHVVYLSATNSAAERKRKLLPAIDNLTICASAPRSSRTPHQDLPDVVKSS